MEVLLKETKEEYPGLFLHGRCLMFSHDMCEFLRRQPTTEQPAALHVRCGKNDGYPPA